jgi:hypothetical protein
MTTTTTTELHEAISSPELADALARFAEAERFTAGEARRVAAAEGELVAADRGDAAQRDIAAQRLAGLRLLAGRTGPARLDGPGLNAVRAAIAAALRFINDRAEYAPPADPRDAPKRLHPADRDALEGQARLRHALASIRLATDTWARAPGAYDLAAVVAMLGRLSDGCRAADAFRAALAPAPAPAPAPVPVSKQRHRK